VPALDELRRRIVRAMKLYEEHMTSNIVESLSTPGEPSFDWDDELTAGIHGITVNDGDMVTITIVSSGVSRYDKAGKIIAAEAEFGPCPHMQPELDKAKAEAVNFIVNAARV
jgi:hypothetical protein